VQAESLGPAIRLGPGYETFWAYIPHFIHSPFYVYAYAFGDCLVNSLYASTRTRRRASRSAISRMLSAGGTKHHSELLMRAIRALRPRRIELRPVFAARFWPRLRPAIPIFCWRAASAISTSGSRLCCAVSSGRPISAHHCLWRTRCCRRERAICYAWPKRRISALRSSAISKPCPSPPNRSISRPDPDGRLRATFEIVWLSGWAPHESQQKPLRPGSAKARLADALGVPEIGTGDKAGGKGER
jgi:hypothetical protein